MPEFIIMNESNHVELEDIGDIQDECNLIWQNNTRRIYSVGMKSLAS